MKSDRQNWVRCGERTRGSRSGAPGCALVHKAAIIHNLFPFRVYKKNILFRAPTPTLRLPYFIAARLFIPYSCPFLPLLSAYDKRIRGNSGAMTARPTGVLSV
jgi:hypothetical protein